MDSQDIKKILHDRALKATTPRLKLLTEMYAYGSAIPYTAIQAAMQSVDRVTLYRTLDSLMSKGVIHKAHQSGNEVYYAICDHHHCTQEAHQHEHLHFKCTQCESVTCETPKQDLNITLPGYKIQQISVSIEGICKSCAQA